MRFTGLRKIELENLYPECFYENDKGELCLHLGGKKQNTKGGKTRDAVTIPENQARMREILATFEPGKLICPAATSHLDIHEIRSMYATDYYNSIAREIKGIRQRFMIVFPMQSVLQGMTEELLYALTTRDDETGKLMFQLI